MISVEKLIKVAKDFEAYQPLKRQLNYQKVQGYIDPKEIVAYLSASYQSRNHFYDYASSVGVVAAAKIMESPATPCYVVTKELTEALLQTDLPDHAYTVQPFVPMGLVLLPPIIKSPEGKPCKWLFFCCLKAGKDQAFINYPDGTIDFQSGGQTLTMDRVAWYSYLHPYSYASTVELDLEGQNINYGTISITDYKINDEEKEQLFTNSISNFLINLMLYMMYRDNSPSENLSHVSSKGFARPLPKLPSTHPKNPVWIGKEYQTKTDKVIEKTSGSHASPRLHWRRGHWRNQPYGKESKSRKLIWIEPVLVNG